MIAEAITAGASRVAASSFCLHAVAITPAGLMELIRSYYFHQLRPSPKTRWVGSCINRFEACSAFTHVTACMLAKSPKRPSTPEAPTASFPPPPLRLLPGGANQFPGGTFTRSGPTPFHGAREIGRRVENRRSNGSLPVDSRLGFRLITSVRFGLVLFPVPAHRTGQADLPHPALGKDSRFRPRKVRAPVW